MTCGIYKLVFEGTDKIYIGYSKNIEKRLSQHIDYLRNNRSSKKLQQAYSTYGSPTIEIIAECPEAELKSLEIEIISIYDTYNTGLNSTIGGDGALGEQGEDNHNASHSNEVYYSVLKELIHIPIKVLEEVSKTTGVSIAIVSNISNGTSHMWLKEKYPDEYSTLESIRNTGRRSKYSTTGVSNILVSPEGVQVTINNISEFSKQYGLLQPKVSDVLNGLRKTHKGWHLPGYLPRVYPLVKDTITGLVHSITNAAKFARDHGLDKSDLSRLLNKKIPLYKHLVLA